MSESSRKKKEKRRGTRNLVPKKSKARQGRRKGNNFKLAKKKTTTKRDDLRRKTQLQVQPRKDQQGKGKSLKSEKSIIKKNTADLKTKTSQGGILEKKSFQPAINKNECTPHDVLNRTPAKYGSGKASQKRRRKKGHTYRFRVLAYEGKKEGGERAGEERVGIMDTERVEGGTGKGGRDHRENKGVWKG